MKKIFLIVFFILYLSSSAFSAVELDADFNGAVDVSKGGTNVQSYADLKTALSIDEVDNTSDESKPVSTATQTAIDGKEDSLGNPSVNGYVLSSTTGGVRDWIDISGGTAIWGSIVGTLADQTDLQNEFDLKQNLLTFGISDGNSVIVDSASVGSGEYAIFTPLGLQSFSIAQVKSNLSLENVDNTTDLNKPISSLTQSEIDTKEDSLPAVSEDVSFLTSLINGVRSFLTISETKTALSINNVDNTSDLNKPVSTNQQIEIDTKIESTSPTVIGNIPIYTTTDGTGIEDSGATIDSSGLSLPATTDPGFTALDSDSPGIDKTAGRLGFNYVDGVDGAENSSWSIWAMIVGTLTSIIDYNPTTDTVDFDKPTTLQAGDIISSELADTAVTPGSYTNLNATVNQQGQITLASSGSGGSSDPTIQATVPVTGDPNGFYIAPIADPTSKHYWKDTLGYYDLTAGGYTAFPLTYLLTITDPGNNDYIQSTDGFINCGNSATDCTYLYTDGDTPELTATADTGRQYDNWTGDATDTSTTTNPDTITMDAAKTVSAAFSALVGGLLASLNCYQDNGQALDTGGEVVTATNITHGTGWDSTPNASVIIDDNADVYSFPANETNGLLVVAQGTIEMWYNHNADVDSSHFFNQSENTGHLRAFRTGLANTISFVVNGSGSDIIVDSSVFTSGYVKLIFTWDSVVNEKKIYVDSVLQNTSTAVFTAPTITTGDFIVGSRGGTFASNGEFQDVKIYDTVIVP